MLNCMICSLVKNYLHYNKKPVDERKKTNRTSNIFREGPPHYGFVQQSENEKLMQNVFMPDREKLHLFVKMLRRNAILKKAVVHKKM